MHAKTGAALMPALAVYNTVLETVLRLLSVFNTGVIVVSGLVFFVMPGCSAKGVYGHKISTCAKHILRAHP